MIVNRQSTGDLSKYIPSPMQALRKATIDGAKTLNMDKEIGSLEPGKKADIITVNMKQPHMMPLLEPTWNLVWYAKGSDVETVIIDGKVVKSHNEILTVNEEMVLEDGQKAGETLLSTFFELFPDCRDNSFLL